MIIISDLSEISQPTAIALGNFDGVHLGHQHVIEPVLPSSRANLYPKFPLDLQVAPNLLEQDLISTVVTFSPHPQEFFSSTPRLLLTPIAEKVEQLKALGVEQLVLLPFDAALAKLTAQEFMQKILVERLNVQKISVGFNFRFGYKRQGSIADLLDVWGNHLNVVPEQTILLDGNRLGGTHPERSHTTPIRISSSNIRTALAQGEVELANTLLGRPYRLIGKVVEGNQLGRQLGFPTANLQLHPQKLLPRDGVYAVYVDGVPDGIEPSMQAQTLPQPVLGVMNIGVRPTVSGDRLRTIEVHLLNWNGDLYGCNLTVHLLKFVRPEKKFTSLEELKAQIEADCDVALSK
ncbi:bifunctional riboflavin kinase/FAD synthetase [Tumidithrix helvetica PCC 7403]|uniref:bifunctional riboflavin kinase/FAD synthetase n=1 Tax=Tumidithrix helvetica TaxID=3457545 RepID=UPI003CB38B99